MKTIVGIASLPERHDSLKKVLDSLTGQVDEIYVVLNYGDIEAPMYLCDYDNVYFATARNERGDSEKFIRAEESNCYYITWDDDLIPKDGLISKLVDACYHYEAVVGFHGRTYLPPITDFRKWTHNYRCLSTVELDMNVNLLGTGCTCFNTNQIKFSLSDFEKPRMADCYFSRKVRQYKIPMVVLAHDKGDLIYTNPKTTIWNTTRDYTEQVKILQSYIK
jgi:hypothetical protein